MLLFTNSLVSFICFRPLLFDAAHGLNSMIRSTIRVAYDRPDPFFDYGLNLAIPSTAHRCRHPGPLKTELEILSLPRELSDPFDHCSIRSLYLVF
jgi:hypothetical protein